MTVEERLHQLIKEQYGSVLQFSTKHEIPNSSVVGVLQRGVKKSSGRNLTRICEALNISMDALADGRIVPLYKRQEGTEAVENIISSTVTAIYDTDTVTLMEVPLTEEERATLATAIELALELIKRGRK